MIPIKPWLYVGKELEAYDKSILDGYQIGAMLHLNEPVNIPDIDSQLLHLIDRADISYEDLEQALDFIFRSKNRNVNILITSEAGTSRSVAIAVAAVKQDGNLSLLDALKVVLKQHPYAKPHPSLWYSLENYFEEKTGFLKVLNLYEEMKTFCNIN